MVKYTDLVSDTICSQITPGGYSGVSVIRVSGPETLQVLHKICPSLDGKVETHRVQLVELVDPNTKEKLDSVLLTYFTEGRSFTGDHVVEISCHGNPLLVQNIISLLLSLGCRLAERGEFSFRAFYNGKLDLVQSESINQLIHSSTRQASKVALGQLGGGLSETFKELESRLLQVLGQLEASIDFSEADIETEPYDDCILKVKVLISKVEELISSYDIGKNLMSRWNVTLAGETNVGKSSLFNSLFQKDIAIVSSQPGTTRDIVSQDTFLGNHSIQFFDTAGLRETPGEIEKLGIAKTKSAVGAASLILWVFDATTNFPKSDLKISDSQSVIFVANKIDLLDPAKRVQLSESFKDLAEGRHCLFVSAQTGDGIEDLKSLITETLSGHNSESPAEVVSQARHYDHLVKIHVYIEEGLALLNRGESPDLISQEFQGALQELNSLLGKDYDDEVLDTIFREFCLGK